MELPVVDPVIAERLRALAADVAEPGEDVIGDLLGTFREDAEARIVALARLLGDGDLLAAAEEVHALKGASGTIGAARAAGVLRDSEAKLRAGELPEGFLASVKAELDACLVALEVALRA